MDFIVLEYDEVANIAIGSRIDAMQLRSQIELPKLKKSDTVRVRIVGIGIKHIVVDLYGKEVVIKAEELNINAQFLSQIETGKTGISIDNAINICNTANCSSGKLFNTLVKTPDNIEKYELLTDRDKSIINNMITILLNTK